MSISKSTGIKSSWLIRPEMHPAPGARVFCFAHAGVGASAFRGWAEPFRAASIEVCFIQLPGREGRLREAIYTSMRELVPALAANLEALIDLPYAFYGHSVGGLIAFETLRYIRRIGGWPPQALFIGATPAPQMPWPYPHMHVLEEDDLLSEMQKRYGGIPSQILESPEIRSLLAPAIRGDMTILETYKYAIDEPLDCPITVFGGLEDHMVARASLEAWQAQTRHSLQLRMFSEGHFFAQTRRNEITTAILAAFSANDTRGQGGDIVRGASAGASFPTKVSGTAMSG